MTPERQNWRDEMKKLFDQLVEMQREINKRIVVDERGKAALRKLEERVAVLEARAFRKDHPQ